MNAGRRTSCALRVFTDLRGHAVLHPTSDLSEKESYCKLLNSLYTFRQWYDKASVRLAAAEKEQENWLQTSPERTPENTKKYEAFRNRMHTAEEEIAKILEE